MDLNVAHNVVARLLCHTACKHARFHPTPLCRGAHTLAQFASAVLRPQRWVSPTGPHGQPPSTMVKVLCFLKSRVWNAQTRSHGIAPSPESAGLSPISPQRPTSPLSPAGLPRNPQNGGVDSPHQAFPGSPGPGHLPPVVHPPEGTVAREGWSDPFSCSGRGTLLPLRRAFYLCKPFALTAALFTSEGLPCLFSDDAE